jgi:hypothetical protein
MMDVKDTGTGGAASITTMLDRAAVARNHELKTVMEKPIRDEEPKKVDSAQEPSKQSDNSTAEEYNTQPTPKSGKLVDVNI